MSPTEMLVDLYSHATPTTRRRGRQWYPTMLRILAAMAYEYERQVAQAVAVAAITSANTTLASNLAFTRAIMAGERLAGCYPKHQTPLVTAVLQTRYPGRFVKGPKCSAFYRAIMGDASALVLDRWAARAAGFGLEPGRNDIRQGVRRELELAYRQGASLCGETVRAFQAITWIQIRETQARARLTDITKGVLI